MNILCETRSYFMSGIKSGKSRELFRPGLKIRIKNLFFHKKSSVKRKSKQTWLQMKVIVVKQNYKSNHHSSQKQCALYIIFGGILLSNNPGIILSLLNFYHYFYSYIEIKQVKQMNSVKRCQWHVLYFIFYVSFKYFHTYTLNKQTYCTHVVIKFKIW